MTAESTDGSLLQGPDRERYVRELFNRIAKPYDRLNRVISLGRDSAWRRAVLDRIGVHAGMHAVDLGTGTGDFFLLLRERVGPSGTVTGIDLSPEMLEVARAKAERTGGRNAELRVGNAAATGLPDASADVVTMGWVLRNVGERAAVYREVLRILRPGGTFVSLDMSQPDSAFVRFGSTVYMNTFMPLVVRLVGGDYEAYTYLARSTARFPRKAELAAEWTAAGFADVSIRSFMAGSIAAHFGKRPPLDRR